MAEGDFVSMSSNSLPTVLHHCCYTELWTINTISSLKKLSSAHQRGPVNSFLASQTVPFSFLPVCYNKQCKEFWAHQAGLILSQLRASQAVHSTVTVKFFHLSQTLQAWILHWRCKCWHQQHQCRCKSPRATLRSPRGILITFCRDEREYPSNQCWNRHLAQYLGVVRL